MTQMLRANTRARVRFNFIARTQLRCGGGCGIPVRARTGIKSKSLESLDVIKQQHKSSSKVPVDISPGLYSIETGIRVAAESTEQKTEPRIVSLACRVYQKCYMLKQQDTR